MDNLAMPVSCSEEIARLRAENMRLKVAIDKFSTEQRLRKAWTRYNRLSKKARYRKSIAMAKLRHLTKGNPRWWEVDTPEVKRCYARMARADYVYQKASDWWCFVLAKALGTRFIRGPLGPHGLSYVKQVYQPEYGSYDLHIRDMRLEQC